MASSSGDQFVILTCTNLNPIELDAGKDKEILISTENIQSWDLDTILHHQTVKIHAYRDRLIEQSSYFHGLLSGSFSESSSDSVSVQWDLPTFMNILKCIYGWPLDVTSNNFLSLFEGALYYGVEMLIVKCRTWFSEVSLSKDSEPQKVQLEDLIHIWNFGLEHASDFVPELCARYLARNFMWATSHKYFVKIPYNLLLDSIRHPCLTVESEMHLSDALLIWIDTNTEQLDCSNWIEDDLTVILKECVEQIRIGMLPLWFAAGKRRPSYFSKLADESVNSIVRLVKIPPSSLINVLEDVELKCLRIRLTEYSEKVNLCGCPQMTAAILLLSVLDSSDLLDPTSWKILECLDKDQCRIPSSLLPTLSFEAVHEVDISKCPALHLDSAIECFSKSFPLLRTIKAAYLLNFRTTTLCKLVQKCPLLCEVDLTVDPSPLIPTKISVVSSSSSLMPPVSNKSIVGNSSLYVTSVYHPGPSLSNITKLTLEGRNDLCDSDLEFISKYCVSLVYLNLKGCISVTDVCVSNLIRRCIKLHSIIVCDTYFGVNSVRALCSEFPDGNSSASHGKRHFDSLASNLQTLHMSCCHGVDETMLLELMSQARMLKSLCLSGTQLGDNALYNFSGSSLEMLDVSNTMISGASLAHIVRGNTGLKYLNARGCKNLFQQQSNTSGIDFSSSFPCEEIFVELGRTCKLEEIALGWGFSHLSLETLKPAITSLRTITVGLGGSLSEDSLRLLPTTCPMLESIVLHFQVLLSK
ncbi:BTB/POZ domain-containing protein FBL11 [Melia azedarach]|uniref:BTB/POZ domain-containing protein FBL11 n=1 Tax=Melia azedarach TaxID=155640 RepID=A0ACC1X1W9_MELAZ|nr:BTB/POZ domain-containing protein FBL11 [Melia azedarach]